MAYRHAASAESTATSSPPRYASIDHSGANSPAYRWLPISDGRTNGALVTDTPRIWNRLGPVVTPSPRRTCLSQGRSSHTPVHDPSSRAAPERTGPRLATPSSRDPPRRSAPSVPVYVASSTGASLGA